MKIDITKLKEFKVKNVANQTAIRDLVKTNVYNNIEPVTITGPQDLLAAQGQVKLLRQALQSEFRLKAEDCLESRFRTDEDVIVLRNIKDTLETIYYQLSKCKLSEQQKNACDFQFFACNEGAWLNLRAIVLANQISSQEDLIAHVKETMFQTKIMEYGRDNEPGQWRKGREIHYTHALKNFVAEDYGLVTTSSQEDQYIGKFGISDLDKQNFIEEIKTYANSDELATLLRDSIVSCIACGISDENTQIDNDNPTNPKHISYFGAAKHFLEKLGFPVYDNMFMNEESYIVHQNAAERLDKFIELSLATMGVVTRVDTDALKAELGIAGDVVINNAEEDMEQARKDAKAIDLSKAIINLDTIKDSQSGYFAEVEKIKTYTEENVYNTLKNEIYEVIAALRVVGVEDFPAYFADAVSHNGCLKDIITPQEAEEVLNLNFNKDNFVNAILDKIQLKAEVSVLIAKLAELGYDNFQGTIKDDGTRELLIKHFEIYDGCFSDSNQTLKKGLEEICTYLDSDEIPEISRLKAQAITMECVAGCVTNIRNYLESVSIRDMSSMVASIKHSTIERIIQSNLEEILKSLPNYDGAQEVDGAKVLGFRFCGTNYTLSAANEIHNVQGIHNLLADHLGLRKSVDPNVATFENQGHNNEIISKFTEKYTERFNAEFLLDEIIGYCTAAAEAYDLSDTVDVHSLLRYIKDDIGCDLDNRLFFSDEDEQRVKSNVHELIRRCITKKLVDEGFLEGIDVDISLWEEEKADAQDAQAAELNMQELLREAVEVRKRRDEEMQEKARQQRLELELKAAQERIEREKADAKAKADAELLKQQQELKAAQEKAAQERIEREKVAKAKADAELLKQQQELKAAQEKAAQERIEREKADAKAKAKADAELLKQQQELKASQEKAAQERIEQARKLEAEKLKQTEPSVLRDDQNASLAQVVKASTSQNTEIHAAKLSTITQVQEHLTHKVKSQDFVSESNIVKTVASEALKALTSYLEIDNSASTHSQMISEEFLCYQVATKILGDHNAALFVSSEVYC